MDDAQRSRRRKEAKDPTKRRTPQIRSRTGKSERESRPRARMSLCLERQKQKQKVRPVSNERRPSNFELRVFDDTRARRQDLSNARRVRTGGSSPSIPASDHPAVAAAALETTQRKMDGNKNKTPKITTQRPSSAYTKCAAQTCPTQSTQ